ncbi:hypothetical protein PIB30_061084 [Stylosanthes scabra]|uniref:Uncharacterized protein n=1 Tax=Stylosanthes scabra TaxID=79078 RepID=A0ABU6SKS8_9FABA|nr:hypothetical protein [Stylosanthes scabra]
MAGLISDSLSMVGPSIMFVPEAPRFRYIYIDGLSPLATAWPSATSASRSRATSRPSACRFDPIPLPSPYLRLWFLCNFSIAHVGVSFTSAYLATARVA